MKLVFAKRVYDQFSEEDRVGLTEVPCRCAETIDTPDPTCEDCEGTGVLYSRELSDVHAREIKENLVSQGVPPEAFEPKKN